MDADLVSVLVCPRKLQILPILRCFGTVEDQGPVCSKMKQSIDRNFRGSEPRRWNRWELPQTVSVHAIRFQFQNFQLFSILVNGDNLDDSIVPKIQRHSVKLPITKYFVLILLNVLWPKLIFPICMSINQNHVLFTYCSSASLWIKPSIDYLVLEEDVPAL